MVPLMHSDPVSSVSERNRVLAILLVRSLHLIATCRSYEASLIEQGAGAIACFGEPPIQVLYQSSDEAFSI